MSQNRFEELLGLLLDDDVTAEQMDGLALVVSDDPEIQHNGQRVTNVSNALAAERGGEEASDVGVAVLTRVSGLLGEQAADWVTGETVPPGTLKWDAGLLQLEFYGGATVVAEGPAEIEILGESRVVCRSGRLRAHVPEPARGFAVIAPRFEPVNLGTEIGLDVSDDGAAEVHVFNGKVELYDAESNRDVATRRELNAGDALTVDHDGSAKPIEVRDADFVTPALLSQMTDGRQKEQLHDWRAFRDSLHNHPRVIAYFPFDRNDLEDRILTGYGADGATLEGAIVGCEWTEGRWPGKTALQFKRPGDRVRIKVPGESQRMHGRTDRLRSSIGRLGSSSHLRSRSTMTIRGACNQHLSWLVKGFGETFQSVINSRIIHSGKGKIEAQYLPYYDYVSIGHKEVPTRKLPLYVESPDSVSSSFGYKTKGECYYHTEEEMLHRFVHTVCAGGNALINNGPMGNGKLAPEAVRLYGVIGDWLGVNGESIYGTRRNPLPTRPAWGDMSVSKDGKTLYLHVLQWPKSGTITVNALPVAAASAVYLANGEKADFVQERAALKITLPAKPLDEYDTVVKVRFTKSIGEP